MVQVVLVKLMLVLTMLPLFTELQGSLANSLAALPMVSPVALTSSTAPSISTWRVKEGGEGWMEEGGGWNKE